MVQENCSKEMQMQIYYYEKSVSNLPSKIFFVDKFEEI